MSWLHYSQQDVTWCGKCKHADIVALLRDVLLARFVYQVKDDVEVSEVVI